MIHYMQRLTWQKQKGGVSGIPIVCCLTRRVLLPYLCGIPLQWHHDERDDVSNHRCLDCFLKRLFGCSSRKTSKLYVTGLCEGNSPGTGDFPAQRSSNAENVSIWWRLHAKMVITVSSNATEPNGARPLAETALLAKLYMCSSKFPCELWSLNSFR